jgi:hypothetical protein
VVRPVSHMRDLPRGTQVVDRGGHVAFVYGAVTLYGLPFLTGSTSEWLCDSTGFLAETRRSAPTTPTQKRLQPIALSGFGLFPFRSPLLRELSLFLQLLRCFSSLAYLRLAYLVQPGVTGHYPSRVSPFGHLRINVCSRLPEAFRSLPRPSSALGAKASTPCP